MSIKLAGGVSGNIAEVNSLKHLQVTTETDVATNP